MRESIRILPYEETIEKLALEEKSNGWLGWCEDNKFFQYPVIEWIEVVAETIKKTGSKQNLEIASGNGLIGKALNETGIPITLSDVIKGEFTENLDAEKALKKHNPDLVFTCWVPFDSEIDLLILSYPSVSWYLTVIQSGPGYVGNELIWNQPGWEFQEIESANKYSVSRSDFLTNVDHGKHIIHGKTFLFTRITEVD